jgi:NAD(P)-dependent dehydrogenase (short-subunit alcohol dehydrogenase family)
MKRLEGKIALITGAGAPAGIGYATALRMAQEGAKVVLTDLNEEGVARCAAALADAGHDAVGLAHDVADASAWDASMSAVLARHGRLDILVNNAGIAVLGPADQLTLEQWRRQIDVNLTSTFLGCRAALAQLRRQGGGGAIVNVSSVAGLVGMPGCAAYAASKGGVRLMTKAIATECAAEGVRVNSVHPGVIMTDIQKVAERDNPGVGEKIQATIPMRRMGDPSDIAAAIAFLASSDARYVTGTEIVVDGGLTAQ